MSIPLTQAKAPATATIAPPGDPMVLDASKLDINGKVNAVERERRRTNRLCYRCGSATHQLSNCPGATPRRLIGNSSLIDDDVTSTTASATGGVSLSQQQAQGNDSASR